ncbi:D-alanine--D-alanine ligase family protein [Rothia sp. P7181]|uniref:D-alanine--D-alanine ligase family protein n=1 Tax=unclassified Rothia (in: high G+C Gram-positive bacteria) TaxID=2689056 RepID=UPI003AE91EDB
MSNSTITKPTVAVLAGGTSSEHSVSLVSASGVLNAIDTQTYDVVVIGITEEGRWYLSSPEEINKLVNEAAQETARTGEEVKAYFRGSQEQVFLPLGEGDSKLRLCSEGATEFRLGPSIDVVFPVLHGPFGEDGTVQGLLESAGLKYVGCGVASSAIGMDKHFMKVAFESAGLDVGPYVVVTHRQWAMNPKQARQEINKLGYPVFVKPARAGSSYGISKVDSEADLDAAIAEAQKHDPKIIIEAGIDGRELECAVLEVSSAEQPISSCVGEIVKEGQTFYDSTEKYDPKSKTKTVCPAELDEDAQTRLRALAVQAFLSLDCEGLARADFFYTQEGKLIINEVNTMPGFTPISMYKIMWEKTGLKYTELVDRLIKLALERELGLR